MPWDEGLTYRGPSTCGRSFYSDAATRPRSPTGRGNGLKTRTVSVRIRPGAPRSAGWVLKHLFPTASRACRARDRQGAVHVRHPLLAELSTPVSAPVITEARLRTGRGNPLPDDAHARRGGDPDPAFRGYGVLSNIKLVAAPAASRPRSPPRRPPPPARACSPDAGGTTPSRSRTSVNPWNIYSPTTPPRTSASSGSVRTPPQRLITAGVNAERMRSEAAFAGLTAPVGALGEPLGKRLAEPGRLDRPQSY